MTLEEQRAYDRESWEVAERRSRRERIATAVLQGVCATLTGTDVRVVGTQIPAVCAAFAVLMADALMAELDK